MNRVLRIAPADEIRTSGHGDDDSWRGRERRRSAPERTLNASARTPANSAQTGEGSVTPQPVHADSACAPWRVGGSHKCHGRR
jgi:hypothetical protein